MPASSKTELLTRAMRALHPRVLFVAGVPRSGTTLVMQFIQMHGGVVALPSDPLTREPLSLSNGGSGRCLADFCNTLGNSRFARNATARAIRLDAATQRGEPPRGWRGSRRRLRRAWLVRGCTRCGLLPARVLPAARTARPRAENRRLAQLVVHSQ